MMKNWLMSLATLMVLTKLNRYIFELRGAAELWGDDDDYPKTRGDLEHELPGLPKSVYRAFQAGVDYQLKGDFENARAQYDKLHKIPRRTNKELKIDLAKYSEVFNFNLNLLDQQERKFKKKGNSDWPTPPTIRP